MSSNRAWKATLRNGLKFEADYDATDDTLTVYVGSGTDWDECPKVQDRSVGHIMGEGLAHNRIWVARLDNHDEILINYWTTENHVTCAYRGNSWNSWGPPVTADDITIHDGDAA